MILSILFSAYCRKEKGDFPLPAGGYQNEFVRQLIKADLPIHTANPARIKHDIASLFMKARNAAQRGDGIVGQVQSGHCAALHSRLSLTLFDWRRLKRRIVFKSVFGIGAAEGAPTQSHDDRVCRAVQ